MWPFADASVLRPSRASHHRIASRIGDAECALYFAALVLVLGGILVTLGALEWSENCKDPPLVGGVACDQPELWNAVALNGSVRATHGDCCRRCGKRCCQLDCFRVEVLFAVAVANTTCWDTKVGDDLWADEKKAESRLVDELRKPSARVALGNENPDRCNLAADLDLTTPMALFWLGASFAALAVGLCAWGCRSERRRVNGASAVLPLSTVSSSPSLSVA